MHTRIIIAEGWLENMSERVHEPSDASAWRRTAVAFATAAAFLVAACGRGTEVGSAVARTGKAAEVVYATGIVEPVYWAKVTALQRKRIVEMCSCEGNPVKKGDVLARLDDNEERAVLTELQARLARLKDDVSRTNTLVERNIASRTSLEEKQTQVSEQEARIAAQKDRITDLELRSPIDGVVLRRDGEVGEIAGTGTADTLFWVGRQRPLRLSAEVNEEDILKVAQGQKTLLRHEGHTSTPLTGTVDRITPKGDPQTKTFRVYILLPDDTPLRIGMSVEANIIVGEADHAVLVPAEAVLDNKVLKIVDGRAKTTTVETGIRGSGMVQIRSGIKAGDVVVSPFADSLKDGAQVRTTGAGRG